MCARYAHLLLLLLRLLLPLLRLPRLLLLTLLLLMLCHGPPAREDATQRFHARRWW